MNFFVFTDVFLSVFSLFIFTRRSQREQTLTKENLSSLIVDHLFKEVLISCCSLYPGFVLQGDLVFHV